MSERTASERSSEWIASARELPWGVHRGYEGIPIPDLLSRFGEDFYRPHYALG